VVQGDEGQREPGQQDAADAGGLAVIAVRGMIAFVIMIVGVVVVGVRRGRVRVRVEAEGRQRCHEQQRQRGPQCGREAVQLDSEFSAHGMS
jgi:hypothetical protein